MSTASLRSLLIHASAGVLIAMVGVAAGQPFFTDDAWWHLALGRAYRAGGPWLDADPLLFSAPGPPATASWWFDVCLYGIDRAAGFAGLRGFHVAIVVAILALAWSSLRRASDSPTVASALTAVFAALCAYRLVQLRPHLLTMFAALALYQLIGERESPVSARRVAVAAVLMAVWVNLHAGFLLGPILMLGALGAIGLTASWRGDVRADVSRARSIAVALGVGTLATFVNPGGLEPHLAYFAAGSDTPSLQRVGDEWSRIGLLGWPGRSPASVLSWAIVWASLLAGTAISIAAVRSWLRGERGIDPLAVALAAIGAVGMLTAVRFVWLDIFVLLLVARWLRTARSVRIPLLAWAATLAVVAVVPAFARIGDWPRVSSAFDANNYAQPYPARKWYAHAVWFMADAELEGRLFNDYFTGGFIGYWLSPRIRSFVNGTLNVTLEAIDSNRPIRERRGTLEAENFAASLDRHGIDLFFGIRLPERFASGAHFYTTPHLEHEPGWIVVFRNLDSAVYLRANARNAQNLARVTDYYAAAGIPFDLRSGFDPDTAIREAPQWALRNGLLPIDFRQLGDAVRGAERESRRAALDRLASIYAALGIYERSIELDRRLLAIDADDASARARAEWSQARLDRPRDRAPALFTHRQADALRRGFLPPEARRAR